MSRVLKIILMILILFMLAACGTATPLADSMLSPTRAPGSPTQTGTPAPTVTPVPPTPTPSSAATSTLTPVLPTSSATPQHDPVEETREAEAFCYQDPRKALDDYLSYLHQGEYEKAARLYVRPFLFEGEDTLPEDMDPTERIAFYAKYLEEFCLGYGTCLNHKIIIEEIPSDRSKLSEEVQRRSEREVIIWVKFYKENGETLEVVIPKGNGFESSTIFDFIVVKLDGCYKSIYTPPMTP